MEMDGIQNAGITAKERLGSIELKLDNILEKLDNKADKSDIVALELRIREIETHGTPQSKESLLQIKDLKNEMAIQNAELLKNQSAMKSTIAYIMGAAATIILVIEIFFRK